MAKKKNTVKFSDLEEFLRVFHDEEDVGMGHCGIPVNYCE